ncbi:MAG: lipopolysaccharide heptosyltransferase II [Candidatus Omnitrophota bacterium]|nr:lipopolysaccharide heptosyltransferase II [Candidatus Omnitrophota bacterium]
MDMKAERILIFNVNWLGDVLFSTAVIRNIRHNFPDSYIACIIPARCYQVLKGNPHLDEIIIFDEKDRHKGPLGLLNFAARLRDKKFDLVFLLHRSFTRALIARMAGIPQRIGYNVKRRGFLLTKKILQPHPDSLHRIDYYLNIIEQAGLKVEDRYADFFVDAKDAEFVEKFLEKNSARKGDFLVVLNPGGNWPLKRWPQECWAALADRLIKELNAMAVIAGSYNDKSRVDSIIGSMREKPIIACDLLNLKQLAALARKADLFITADTGPLHIANAVGTKLIIALFGPTSPALTGPVPDKNVIIIQKDVGCKIPCYMTKCPDNRCMKAITVEDVMEKVRGIKEIR